MNRPTIPSSQAMRTRALRRNARGVIRKFCIRSRAFACARCAGDVTARIDIRTAHTVLDDGRHAFSRGGVNPSPRARRIGGRSQHGVDDTPAGERKRPRVSGESNHEHERRNEATQGSCAPTAERIHQSTRPRRPRSPARDRLRRHGRAPDTRARARTGPYETGRAPRRTALTGGVTRAALAPILLR